MEPGDRPGDGLLVEGPFRDGTPEQPLGLLEPLRPIVCSGRGPHTGHRAPNPRLQAPVPYPSLQRLAVTFLGRRMVGHGILREAG
jgi:hypothetical protein